MPMLVGMFASVLLADVVLGTILNALMAAAMVFMKGLSTVVSPFGRSPINLASTLVNLPLRRGTGFGLLLKENPVKLVR